MKHQEKRFSYHTRAIKSDEDAMRFINGLTEATIQGFTMENCGVNGTGTDCLLAWAILSKPAEEEE